MRTIPAVFLLLLLLPIESHAGGGLGKGEILNLEMCVGLALRNNPAPLAARNTVIAAQSRVGQAKSNFYPQISLSSGYRRLSAGGGAEDSLDRYSGSLTLNQNVYDFGETSKKTEIAGLNADSSRYDLENVSAQTVLNVKKAYYGVLQAGRNRDVAAQTVLQFERHLEQARGFFELGRKPKFDVTKAEVDLSNARLGLIKAENAVRLARANLNNAMGVPPDVSATPQYSIEDNLSFEKYDISFEEALSRAYRNRPDLQSVIAKRKAVEGSVALAGKGYYPVLTGNAAYGWNGQDFPLQREWSVGATLSLPLFSGFLTGYQVGEARANLNVIEAGEASLRQTVALEVEQAYLSLGEAGERVPVARLAVKQAQENLDLATGRYEVGVGSPIELTDAQVTYANAVAAYNQALYDYKVAEASIEKAMGEGR